MENPLKILFIDESFESYCFLIGYVLQKKPLDYIIKRGLARGQTKYVTAGLNTWLRAKGYPVLIPSQESDEILSDLTKVSDHDLRRANNFIKNTKAPLIVCTQNQIKNYDYQTEWGWNHEVLKTILSLSDLPTGIKDHLGRLFDATHPNVWETSFL